MREGGLCGLCGLCGGGRRGGGRRGAIGVDEVGGKVREGWGGVREWMRWGLRGRHVVG